MRHLTGGAIGFSIALLFDIIGKLDELPYDIKNALRGCTGSAPAKRGYANAEEIVA